MGRATALEELHWSAARYGTAARSLTSSCGAEGAQGGAAGEGSEGGEGRGEGNGFGRVRWLRALGRSLANSPNLRLLDLSYHGLGRPPRYAPQVPYSRRGPV